MRLQASLVTPTIALAFVVSGYSISAQAAPFPQPEPPTPAELTQATRAMLQPGMVPTELGGPGAQQIGYYIPTGGQDPYPVCQPPNADKAVLPDLTMTIGYFSANGQATDQSVNQQAIVYPSVDGAQANWAAVAEQIQKQCSFTGKGKNSGVVITNGQAPAQNALWTNYQGGPRNGWSEYTVIGLAGDAIVSLRFTNYERPATTSDQRSAVDSLWAQLSEGFTDRATLSGVQSTTLSIAEAAMVNPKDVGADIPTGTPEEGSWASFTASLPGTAPIDPCEARLNFFPGGNGSFSSSFGDDGGPISENGLIYQRAFTYNDTAAADTAWDRISKQLPSCNQRSGKLFDKTTSASRQVARQSAITVDGTPGWFIREIRTDGSDEKDLRFTTRSYQLLLKSGNVISWLTYAKSEDGIKQFFIDEQPINELAVQLINRFTDTVVTTS